MSKVALNTAALFIFAITCMILVGPLVHLPSQVPVLCVLAALTITTLDTLSFQGKGANLFLDWFAQQSSAYRDRVVHHEAGHFLVAHLLDIPITGYTLSATEALKAGYSGMGGVQLKGVDLNSLKADRLGDYCTVCVAGRVAEQLCFQSVQGGADDLGWLRSQLRALGLKVQPYEQQATLKARGLIQEQWEAYLALVEQMKQHTPIQDCAQVIEAHRVASQG
ncbi:ATP-dependent Zn protease [Lyngbya confervoides]|uniref:ATP-dependent Zn protease n=1 Tax=Lyngbya confervoides BDU141951 TaxID=1574623 RepID=A0ABD4T2K0_9CYAN|nr:ATP-dependent Zn protease [Lyngbya confervoides]MCM1982846.1 ATP-dependent Zn protease [Lyngbya confervoides BDU141951]